MLETLAKVIEELGLTPHFSQWTEGQWAAVEKRVAELEKLEDEKDLPVCRRCGTKPSESNGFEERFCQCGMVHVVTKRPERKNENQVAKEFKASQ